MAKIFKMMCLGKLAMGKPAIHHGFCSVGVGATSIYIDLLGLA
jgi:hypothetical protein